MNIAWMLHETAAAGASVTKDYGTTFHFWTNSKHPCGLSAGDIGKWAKSCQTWVKTAHGYASGNFPVFANPNALADAKCEAAIGDFLLRLRRAYLWANSHYLDFAQAQSAETRVAVGDLVELWNGRSTDYAVLPAGPQVAAAHQQVADVFLQAGVLDAPVRVEPLRDSRYAPLLAGGA